MEFDPLLFKASVSPSGTRMRKSTPQKSEKARLSIVAGKAIPPYLYLHRNIVRAILIVTISRARETIGYARLNL